MGGAVPCDRLPASRASCAIHGPQAGVDRPDAGLQIRTVSPAGGYELANVNRWRGKLNLKPITADELSKITETFKVGEYDCTLVRLIGTGGGGSMSGAPLTGGPSIATTPSASGHEAKSL